MDFWKSERKKDEGVKINLEGRRKAETEKREKGEGNCKKGRNKAGENGNEGKMER